VNCHGCVTLFFPSSISFQHSHSLRSSFPPSQSPNTRSPTPTMPRLTTSLPRSLDADYLLSINHSDLARLLFLSNNLEAAERAYLSALHLRRLRLGDDAYSLARVRNELGELYLKMGRLEEAREYLEDAERVRCRESCLFSLVSSLVLPFPVATFTVTKGSTIPN
jgi:tetratricopeptide (TPR) repeat protein